MASTPFPANSHSLHPIRPINLARDMPAVMRLLNQVFSPTLDADGRRALNNMSNQPSLVLRINQLGNKIAPGFIYEWNGRVLGNVSIIPTTVKGRVIIANVAVDEDFRRRGIAQELMEATLDHLDMRGIDSVLLQVDVDNEGAAQLYERLGFVRMGSTTYWVASPGGWRELPSMKQYQIRPMRSNEHRLVFDLDRSCYPVDLNWPDPIDNTTYRNGFLKQLDNFLNGRSVETWVIADTEQIYAAASIWSEWGRPHRLTLRVPEEYRDQLATPMMAKLVRRLNYLRRRHASIEHPMEDDLVNELLVAANFYAKRNLTTMKLRL